MGKYSPPEVTIRDVAAALPYVERPLLVRISLYPVPGNSTTLTAVVELCAVRKDGATVVWRRWGAKGTATGQRSLLSGLLLAAQEAFWYCEGYRPDELVRRVCWDCGVPLP